MQILKLALSILILWATIFGSPVFIYGFWRIPDLRSHISLGNWVFTGLALIVAGWLLISVWFH